MNTGGKKMTNKDKLKQVLLITVRDIVIGATVMYYITSHTEPTLAGYYQVLGYTAASVIAFSLDLYINYRKRGLSDESEKA